MEVTFFNIHRKMREVLKALDRNEPVTIFYRGKKKALLMPMRDKKTRVQDHPAFGMWKDRKDMRNVRAYVRKLRQPRYANLLLSKGKSKTTCRTK